MDFTVKERKEIQLQLDWFKAHGYYMVPTLFDFFDDAGFDVEGIGVSKPLPQYL